MYFIFSNYTLWIAARFNYKADRVKHAAHKEPGVSIAKAPFCQDIVPRCTLQLQCTGSKQLEYGELK